MRARTRTSVPEVAYVVEALCFDCARFFTTTVAGWDKETWLELRDQTGALKALCRALPRPECPCCGRASFITSLGHSEACRHLVKVREPSEHFTPLDPQL